MRKSLELSEPTSCLNKAESDEPIFVLRANDPSAPYIVRTWALTYRVQKRRLSPDGQLSPEHNRKALEADVLADQMEHWRRARESAIKSSFTGDLPPGP